MSNSERVALIDGDSIVYKTGFALEEELDDGSFYVNLDDAKQYIDGIIEGIMFATDCDSIELWLGAKGTNFRYEIANKYLSDDYKHNRKDSRKPDKFDEMVKYIKKKYKSKSAVNCEVDDVVVTKKTESPDKYILCAVDKDVLYQTVGIHYNYFKDEWVTVTEPEAIWYSYYQCLVGDVTDGYKGCKGIGPVKAIRILGLPAMASRSMLDRLLGNKVSNTTKDKLYALESFSERTMWAKILCAYRHSKQTKEEALATMRLANMHQLYRNSEGKLRVKLWKPLPKGSIDLISDDIPF